MVAVAVVAVTLDAPFVASSSTPLTVLIWSALSSSVYSTGEERELASSSKMMRGRELFWREAVEARKRWWEGWEGREVREREGGREREVEVVEYILAGEGGRGSWRGSWRGRVGRRMKKDNRES